jgi:acyl-[acyl-carrier-protein]-phospholipid O-acyltransferase/long-chain-fatty-acid--[acyl-carrier-protein] ligase
MSSDSVGHFRAPPPVEPPEEEGRQGPLVSRNLLGLTAVQFLTVLNDNGYRWLVVPIGYVVLGEEHKGLILALGLACFVVPYLVLVAPAAYLADHFPKRTVISACMLLQALIVAMGFVAILNTSAFWVFSALTLMGAQGALLNPAKGGTIPETIVAKDISAANGILGLAMVAGALIGTLLGNELYVVTAPVGKTRWGISAATLIGVALAGWAASLLITKCKAADPGRPAPTHLFAQTWRDMTVLKSDRGLLGAASASAFFWFLAALAQVNVYLLGTTSLQISQAAVGPLMGMLALGVAVGSPLAGAWSAGKVELGLVPIAAAGMAVTSVLMFVVSLMASQGDSWAYYWGCLCLFFMGVSAGLYDVPLMSYLQYNSPAKSLGQVLASSNFLSFSAMLLASGVFWLLRSVMEDSAGAIFLVAGLLTTVVFLVALAAVPRQTLRTILRPLRWLGSTVSRSTTGRH